MDVILRQGKIIIPAFSLGRTQVLVYVLHRLTDEGHIPRIPIYVDSPLATDITDVFRRHSGDFDQETLDDFGKGHTPLDFRNLIYTQSTEESKQLNNTKGPFIVISGSGMMTAGRVVHHLRNTISDHRNAVIITGYQAVGTLGRRLLEGAERVELYGEWFDVRAQIEVFNEFSAHADRAQLTEYVSKFQGVKQIILVHGEPEQADVFRDELAAHNSAWQVERPNEGDTITLF
jgi:metallo-beta-lactamase family protein